MNNTFFQTTVQTFEALLDPAANANINAALSAIAGPLTALLVIYVIVTGVLCSFGEFSARLAVTRILRAGFVAMLLSATYFNPYVRDMFITTLPAWMASALSSTPGTSLPQQCDLIRSALLHASAAVYQGTSWQDIDVRLGIAAADNLGTFFLAVLVLIYEMARTFTALTVCVAPFVIGAYLFDATKSYVDGWIGKLVGLALLQLLVNSMAQIIVLADTAMMKQATVGTSLGTGSIDQVGSLFAVVVFFAMMAGVAVGLPSIAYSIGRAAAMNTGAGAALRLPAQARRALASFARL